MINPFNASVAQQVAQMNRATTHPPKAYADAIPVTIPKDFARSVAEAVKGIAAELVRFRENLATSAQQMARTFALIHERAVIRATVMQNDPIRVAGLQGRYLVRAGHLNEDDLVALVTALLTGAAEGTEYLTTENRALVVAAALRGWASGYKGDAPEVLSWRRAFGDTHVQVGRAA